MKRRDFIALSLLAGVSSNVFVQYLSALTPQIGLNLDTNRASIIDRLMQKYSSFKEMQQLFDLNKITYFLGTDSSETNSQFKKFDLVSINQSYGRFANFLPEEIKDLNEVYFITRGKAGHTLFTNTKLKIINRFSVKIKHMKYMSDAFPHYFNSCNSQRTSHFKSYWIDTTTRAPLSIQIYFQNDLNPQVLNKFKILKNELAKEIFKVENVARASIASRFPVFTFDTIIDYQKENMTVNLS